MNSFARATACWIHCSDVCEFGAFPSVARGGVGWWSGTSNRRGEDQRSKRSLLIRSPPTTPVVVNGCRLAGVICVLASVEGLLNSALNQSWRLSLHLSISDDQSATMLDSCRYTASEVIEHTLFR